VQKVEESLPAALLQRFTEHDLLARSAALSFHALVWLAPPLVLWLKASLYSEA